MAMQGGECPAIVTTHIIGALHAMTDVTAKGSGSPYPSHLVLTAAEARLIVFGVLTAMMMAALDQTIVSTALSTIGRELGNSTQLTWVVTAYLLAATVVTPIYGKLSDLYGRRVTLLFAAVFLSPAPRLAHWHRA